LAPQASRTGVVGGVKETRSNFPRSLRLLTSAQYQAVFRDTACRSSDQLLTVIARPNQQPYPRLGLAISKKAVKTSVGRNRIKRLVRESFRHQQQTLGGLDIVVMARTAAMEASNSEIAASLQGHWRRLLRRLQS
jgi:ribonuclease P protein component